jgi:pterin-4a-carbinolamine dehydratase
MKQLQRLHEQFIEKAQRPMDLGKLPINAQEPEVPILASDRWFKTNGVLTKKYQFRRIEDRETFINKLFMYERETQHHAEIFISGDCVSLKLFTHDIGKASELDKEYASFADATFKDVVYSQPYHGIESEHFEDLDE